MSFVFVCLFQFFIQFVFDSIFLSFLGIFVLFLDSFIFHFGGQSVFAFSHFLFSIRVADG